MANNRFVQFLDSVGDWSGLNGLLNQPLVKHGVDKALEGFEGVRDWSNQPAIEAADTAYQRELNLMNQSKLDQQDLMKEQHGYNMALQNAANRFSADEAEKTRIWQEELSNTAYQRGVDDMRKAGINPIFAYGGAAASTPSGATASGRVSSAVAPSSARGSAPKANVSTDFLKDVVSAVASTALAVSSVANTLSSIKIAGKKFALDSSKHQLNVSKHQLDVDTNKHLESAFKKYKRRAYIKGYYSGAMDSDQLD